jgi:glycerol-3-phosphate O-acyltransferase
MAFIKSLGKELTYTLTDNLIVMITSLVASVLLQFRKGISVDEILRKTTWIYDEIKARGGELGLSNPPSTTSIQSALKFLDGFVDMKRNILEPSVSAKKDYANIIMLSYYRNNLIHLFLNDAIVFCSLLGLGSIEDTNGIKLSEVYDKSIYLSYLLSEEFMIRHKMNTKEEFNQVIQFMHTRGYFKLN